MTGPVFPIPGRSLSNDKVGSSQHFQVHIRGGVGSLEQFITHPDHGLETIEGGPLLMPPLEGQDEYPNNYLGMKGLFLERINDGIYRRKSAWRIAGEYSTEGLGADHCKVTHMWWVRGEERRADGMTASLHKGEFASLWNGEACSLKRI